MAGNTTGFRNRQELFSCLIARRALGCIPLTRVLLLRVVLALAMGSLPVVPPEHVHEKEEHGHEHVLVHRHLGAHVTAHHHESGDAMFDEDEGLTLALDAVYTVPPPAPVLSQPPAIVLALIEPPPVHFTSRSRDDVEYLIHGPPRAPTGLRAPPLSSRL